MSVMRAAVLSDYAEVAREVGLDPEAQLRSVGLSLDAMRSPDHLVASDAVVRLLENSASASGCLTIGLKMAQRRRMSHFGVMGLLLTQQRTPRDMLDMVLQYQALINDSLAVRLEENRGTALLREEILTSVPMPLHQTVELAMAANVQLFRAILGPDWRPWRVYFRHAAPDSLDLHLRIFRCPCEFSRDLNAMSFPSRDLDLLNPAADPQMARYAIGFIETLPKPKSSAVTLVRRQIYLLLPLGRATIKQVAQTLGCSVRKLQLDLTASGTSFGELLDEARDERARLYLRNAKFELSHVAALLGYNHHSSFARWFSGRFGVSPNDWRRGAPAVKAAGVAVPAHTSKRGRH